MRKIHFDRRCLIICSPEEKAAGVRDAIEAGIGTDTDLDTILKLLGNDSPVPGVLITSDAPEDIYRHICSLFKEVNAAGGLVTDTEGRHLLISRNGLWDLPKGHQESGEDIAVTAVREVQEETGADRLETRGLICITDHCYFRDGIWHLKHTWWYDMLYTGTAGLRPQTEEGITRVIWAAGQELAHHLENTYPSILEVFRSAGV